MATVVSALVVLLTTPLQAAGEEYLFRGYLLQAFGSLFRSTVGGDRACTAVLFAFAHGAQNFPLFFDRFAFGLIAGWLVTRTGGLEAGIALHILNNFLAFGLALSFGDLTSTLNVSEVSWWNIVLTLTQSVVYTAPGAGGGPTMRSADPHPAARREPSRSPDRRSRRPERAASRQALWAVRAFWSRADRDVYSRAGFARGPTHGVWGNWQPDWFWSS